MTNLRRLISVCLLAVVAPFAVAADLATVDRSIAKEPAYKSKSPRYCLLVFGPNADSRVWLVIDGDRLFVDRNGRGDLTETGKLVEPKKGDVADPDAGEYRFEIGDVTVGGATHKNLTLSIRRLAALASDRNPEIQSAVAKDRSALAYYLSCEIAMSGRRGDGPDGRVRQIVSPLDVRGVLRFGASPGEAPIVHFGGPLQVTLYDRPRLTAGREAELYLGVGTPGDGPGTTAFVATDPLIPEPAFARVEIEYPPAKAGEPPVKELYELKGRC